MKNIEVKIIKDTIFKYSNEFTKSLRYLTTFYLFFLKIYLFIFRERGREAERGRETFMCGFLLCAPYWDLSRNPGMCPDWESNL